MKLEQQVASLELCKKLKELGVKQVLNNGDWAWVDSELHLAHNDNDTGWFLGNDYMTFFPLENEDTESPYYNKPTEYCKAFTVAEFGEMLPEWLDYKGIHYNLKIEKKGEYWVGTYFQTEFENVPKNAYQNSSENEADARAKMLIYLLENNLTII